MSLLEEKQFPQNYSSDAVRVLKALSLSDGAGMKLVGSMALRSQQYAGDFDANDYVCSNDGEMRALDLFARRFKQMIKDLRSIPDTFIADIKAGIVEDWVVIPTDARVVEGKVVGFNAVASKARVDELVRQKIMTPAEGKAAYALLDAVKSPESFLVAKNEIKPQVVRWTPADVMRGYVVLRDGSHYHLQDAFHSNGITKVDVISWMNGNHFAEFSCIYYFYIKSRWINVVPINLQQSLQEDITYYLSQGNPFKALKRRFILAKHQHDVPTMERLQPILNGDLGRIYSLVGDINTLLYMLDNYQNFPNAEVDFEIDQFRDRFSRIYGIKDFIYAEPQMLGKLAAALRAPRSSRGRVLMRKQLAEVEGHLQQILATHTPKNV